MFCFVLVLFIFRRLERTIGLIDRYYFNGGGDGIDVGEWIFLTFLLFSLFSLQFFFVRVALFAAFPDELCVGSSSKKKIVERRGDKDVYLEKKPFNTSTLRRTI